MPQVGLLDFVDVDAIVADFAVVDVVEPVDQVSDGGLTGTSGSYEGDLLTGLGVEGDVMEDNLFRRVAEVHVIEPHVAGQPGVGDGAVVVGMLPGPDHGALGALGQGAVGVLLGVDQGHVAIVGFGLFIQQGEDPVGAGQTHDDHVDLVGHLADRAGELLGHIQERHHDADTESHAGEADVGGAGQQQGTAHQCHDHVHHVADIAQQRHENVGETVAVAGVEEDFVVDFVKVGLGSFLVAEDLNDLLAGHHFLHERLGVGQSDLLAQEIGGGALGDRTGGEDHADDANHHYKGQDDAVVDHNAEHHRQRDGGDENIGKALADKLAQGVDIVGVVAHDVAVTIGVKVPDGQVLHVVEHLLTHLFQGTLGDDGHHLRVEGAGDEADRIHGYQDSYKAENFSGDRRPVAALVALVYQGDDLLQEDRRHGADESVDQDAHQRDRQQHRIEFKQGFQ